MKSDEVRIQILKDGTVKMETDGVSAANHSSAEQFIRETNRQLGGKSTRKARKGHSHSGLGHHSHEGEHHEH